VFLLSLGVVLAALGAVVLRIVWLLDEKPAKTRPECDEVPVSLSRRAA